MDIPLNESSSYTKSGELGTYIGTIYREHIAKNDDFGRHRCRCLIRKDLVCKYFNKLTAKLMGERNLSQGALKVVAGAKENVDVMPEYQLA